VAPFRRLQPFCRAREKGTEPVRAALHAGEAVLRGIGTEKMRVRTLVAEVVAVGRKGGEVTAMASTAVNEGKRGNYFAKGKRQNTAVLPPRCVLPLHREKICRSEPRGQERPSTCLPGRRT